jgi:hypothetical protein
MPRRLLPSSGEGGRFDITASSTDHFKQGQQSGIYNGSTQALPDMAGLQVCMHAQHLRLVLAGLQQAVTTSHLRRTDDSRAAPWQRRCASSGLGSASEEDYQSMVADRSKPSSLPLCLQDRHLRLLGLPHEDGSSSTNPNRISLHISPHILACVNISVSQQQPAYARHPMSASSSGTQSGAGRLDRLCRHSNGGNSSRMHAATNSNAQPLLVKRAEFGDIQPSSRVKSGWLAGEKSQYSRRGWVKKSHHRC